jgi:hypothetical protein
MTELKNKYKKESSKIKLILKNISSNKNKDKILLKIKLIDKQKKMQLCLSK